MSTQTEMIELTLKIDDYIAQLKKAGLDTSKFEKDFDKLKSTIKGIEPEATKSFMKLIELLKKSGINTAKLEKEFENIQKEVAGFGKSSSLSFTELNQGIEIAQKGIMLFKKAFDFAEQFKNASRDANEIRNKYAVVFESISRKAEQTAERISKSFGLAKSTSKKLLSSTGDLLVGLGYTEDKALEMSEAVVALGSDLSSFTNIQGGATTAVEALTKLLVGETESAKALGIVIRQDQPDFIDRVATIKEQTGATETQARAEVLLQMATEQSSKAIGDYARTSDQLANVERRRSEVQKEMAEKVGQRLVPIYQLYNKVALSVLETFQEKESEKIRKQSNEFENLSRVYLGLKEKTQLTAQEKQTLDKAIKDLQTQYPAYLKNVNLEKGSYEEVSKAINKVSDSLKAKAMIAIRDEKLQPLYQREADLQDQITIALEKQAEAEFLLGTNIESTGNKLSDYEIILKRQKEYQTQNLLTDLEMITVLKVMEGQVAQSKMQVTYLTEEIDKNNKEQVKLIGTYSKFSDLLNEEVTPSLDETGKAIAIVDPAEGWMKALTASRDTVSAIQADARKLRDAYAQGKITLEEFTEKALELRNRLHAYFEANPLKLKIEKPKLEEEAPVDFRGSDEIEAQRRLDNYNMEKEYLDNRKLLGLMKETEYQEELKKIRTKYDQEQIAQAKMTAEQVLDVTSQVLSQLAQYTNLLYQEQADATNERFEEQKASLDAQLQAQTLSQVEYNIQLKELEKKKNEELKEINQDKKRVQIAQAYIDTYAGMTKNLTATPWPAVNNILAGLTFALGMKNIQMISKQKLSRGGVLRGKKHSQGGIDIGNNYEAQDKEIVLNDGVYKNRLGRKIASLLNTELGNGVSFDDTATAGSGKKKLADGGVIRTTETRPAEGSGDMATLIQRVEALTSTVAGLELNVNVYNNIQSDIADLTQRIEKQRNVLRYEDQKLEDY